MPVLPLTLLLLLPVLVTIVIGIAPVRSAKPIAVMGAAVALVLSLLYFGHGAADSAGFFVSERVEWLPELGLSYHVGMDGVSLLMVVLTTLISLFAIAAAPEQPERTKIYFILLMLLETALIAAFTALDLVLFFLFFELSLIPVFLLIGLYGGRRRQPAALKFFVYTTVGSLTMLAGILALRVLSGSATNAIPATFDFVELQAHLATNPLPIQTSLWIMAAFAIAFAVKTPLWPLHSWQADTYAESPTPAVVIAAAVLSKLGTYGFYRFCLGLFPDASRVAAPVFVGLAVIAILYGAIVAVAQKDVRRLLAFSSVSHLGFVVLGLFAFNSTALTGAILQMVNHGISTGALFLLVGMLAARNKPMQINQLGGLWDEMPVFSRIFLVVTLSSIALPLTNGFVGEFMILLGAFQSFEIPVVFATLGVILSAIYMLWMFQRVFYGAVRPDGHAATRKMDLSRGELAIAIPFVIFIFLLGIVPAPFVRAIQENVQQTLTRTQTKPRSPVALNTRR